MRGAVETSNSSGSSLIRTPGTPHHVAPGVVQVVGACSSCGGRAWKFVRQWADLRAIGQGATAVRRLVRRPCLDCAGSGRTASC